MTTLEPVEVIQADRDAAANIWRDFIAKPGECIVERQMRSGSMDWDGSLVQTLARHRIATAQALEARVAELEEKLVSEREDNLWAAFSTGDLRSGSWDHMCMSDGEWLAQECGFDPRQRIYDAEEIRNAIPLAARAALKGSSHER